MQSGIRFFLGLVLSVLLVTACGGGAVAVVAVSGLPQIPTAWRVH